MAFADQEDLGTETAGGVARPPVLFLSSLILGFALGHLLPLPSPVPRIGLVHWISAAIAGSLIVIGMGVFAASVRDFSKAGTPVQRTKPTRVLVTTGVFGWSRNPIYLAMFLVYVGIGIVVRSPWILVLTLPLAILMQYGIVAREETYLERRFGDAYRAYRGRVRRWL